MPEKCWRSKVGFPYLTVKGVQKIGFDVRKFAKLRSRTFLIKADEENG